jgi:SAM-dependent methyltransferase
MIMISRERAQELHRGSARQLGRHARDPYVALAPELIAKKMGMAGGMEELQSAYEAATKTFHHALSIEQFQPQLAKLARHSQLALNPLDLMHSSIEYIYLHLAMKSFFPSLNGKTILQLACNFGPFLHFLKQQEGATVFGVDTAVAAGQYAQEHGVNVLKASAAALPFRDGSFDLVVSSNFLCPFYMNAIKAYGQDPIIQPVMREVERTLKPGGLFFSQFESGPNQTRSLTRLGAFSAEAVAQFYQLQDIAVYVKS